jgi:hypothetical protein
MKRIRGKMVTHSRTALEDSFVLNFVNVLTYSSVLLYTLKKFSQFLDKESYLAYVRCIRRVLFSVLEKVLHLGNEQATSVIEL